MSYYPYVIESTSQGERVYDIFSRLLKDRIIFLSGAINDDVAKAITAQLLFLQSQDSKADINFYINSPGGIVTSGLAIYDTMQHVKPKISTFCVGQAVSMASVLLAAGHTGRRFCLPNSRVMIHQPSGATQGQASDIVIHAQEIIRAKEILMNIYKKHTKKKLEDIEKHLERDFFMNPKEAKKFGLIDKIL